MLTKLNWYRSTQLTQGTSANPTCVRCVGRCFLVRKTWRDITASNTRGRSPSLAVVVGSGSRWKHTWNDTSWRIHSWNCTSVLSVTRPSCRDLIWTGTGLLMWMSRRLTVSSVRRCFHGRKTCRGIDKCTWKWSLSSAACAKGPSRGRSRCCSTELHTRRSSLSSVRSAGRDSLAKTVSSYTRRNTRNRDAFIAKSAGRVFLARTISLLIDERILIINCSVVRNAGNCSPGKQTWRDIVCCTRRSDCSSVHGVISHSLARNI